MNTTNTINKNRLKQLIYGLELRGLAIICNGIVHRTPKQTVLKLLRKEIGYSRAVQLMNDAEIGNLDRELHNLYLKISKKTVAVLRKIDKQFGKKENYQENLRQRQNVVYKTVRDEAIFNGRLEKKKNFLANSVEFHLKREGIFGYNGILANRNSPFYLCSVHKNAASDHADWQGKLYYDEDWESYVDEERRADVREFIARNDLKTVQWVVGSPVYLITRPNCRHYFRNIPVEEALNSDSKTLVTRYKMIEDSKIPLSREKMAYNAYYERLKALRYLKKICPSEELDSDIKKTGRLVRFWASRATKQRG